MPELYEDLITVLRDIRYNKIFNPFVILLAFFGIFMRNCIQLFKHTFFWWIIIPQELMKE